jgi:hypothetical protein
LYGKIDQEFIHKPERYIWRFWENSVSPEQRPLWP